MAVIVSSYLLFSPGSESPETATINTVQSIPAPTKATSNNQADSNLPAGLINTVDESQLLALLPTASPEDNLPVADRQPLTLWQQVEQQEVSRIPEQLKILTVQADPARLNDLQAGRKIEFVIPHTQEQVSGKITAQRRL